MALTLSESVPLSNRVIEVPLLRPATLPPTVKAFVVQVAVTFVTLALATVPEPFAIVQVSLVGCAEIVTLYAAPVANAALKVKAPLALTVSESEPLSSKVIDVPPFKPDTVPPMVKVALGLHETETLVTFAVPTVPVPPVTEQVSLVGCVAMVTL